jgi:hypothetical protein
MLSGCRRLFLCEQVTGCSRVFGTGAKRSKPHAVHQRKPFPDRQGLPAMFLESGVENSGLSAEFAWSGGVPEFSVEEFIRLRPKTKAGFADF